MMATALFSIACLNSYYSSGDWEDLKLIPDNDTSGLLDRFQMVLKPTKSGLSCYYLGRLKRDDFLAYLMETKGLDHMRFLMQSSDAYYAMKCDLPIDWSGALQYDSSRLDDVVQQNTDPVMTPILADETLVQPNMIGAITLHLSDILSGSRTFKVFMKARDLVWRYLVVNRSGRALEKLSIGNSGQTPFTESGTQNLPTGERATVFTSEPHHIPLTQGRKTPFTLQHEVISRISNSPRIHIETLVKNLAVARSDTLQRDGDDGTSALCASVYVYV